MGIAGTIWSYLKLRDLGIRRRTRIDWWGNLTFAVGLISLMIGVTYGIEPLRSPDHGLDQSPGAGGAESWRGAAGRFLPD